MFICEKEDDIGSFEWELTPELTDFVEALPARVRSDLLAVLSDHIKAHLLVLSLALMAGKHGPYLVSVAHEMDMELSKIVVQKSKEPAAS
jgi:hypothetical protein